jgi:hypothetical protein
MRNKLASLKGSGKSKSNDKKNDKKMIKLIGWNVIYVIYGAYYLIHMI